MSQNLFDYEKIMKSTLFRFKKGLLVVILEGTTSVGLAQEKFNQEIIAV